MIRARQGATSWSFSFRQKILLLPGLAAVALLLVLALTMGLGRTNEARLRSIRDGYYPSVQLSRSLQENLARIQRGLQDAATARDVDRLEEADSLRAAVVATIAEARKNPVADAALLDSLAGTFDSYYALARQTTKGLIAGEMGEK